MINRKNTTPIPYTVRADEYGGHSINATHPEMGKTYDIARFFAGWDDRGRTLKDTADQAAFVVNACNTHDAALEILKDIAAHLKDGAALHAGSMIFKEDAPALDVINAVIKQMEGK